MDFYNIQYYNQNESYQDCGVSLASDFHLTPQSIVSKTPYSSCYVGTALAEIHKLGVPWSKLVLGKPMHWTEAHSG